MPQGKEEEHRSHSLPMQNSPMSGKHQDNKRLRLEEEKQKCISISSYIAEGQRSEILPTFQQKGV